MPKYDLLIFDFDGTLVDTAPDIAFHANVVLERLSFQRRSLEQVKKAIGRGVHDLMMTLAPPLAKDSVLLEQAVKMFKEKYIHQPVIETVLYPGVRDMVEGPLKDYKKAIVTNKPHELTLQILRLLDLESIFEVVIGMGIEYPPKPNPQSVISVMEQLKSPPSKTILVGDSRIDWQTATNAGISFLRMTYGYDDEPIPGSPASGSAYDWKSHLI